MSKIGHASIDENGRNHSGASGDQTGKEVCIRNWYDGKWHTLLRCGDSKKAEIMAKSCEAACNNPNVGYDQYQRNTLRKQAQLNNYDLSKVGKCECDCSSLMTVCAECAGIDIPYSNGTAPSTRTMEDVFESTNQFTSYHDVKYLTSDKHLKRGDILIKDGHTVMVLEDGEKTNEVASVNVSVPVLKKGSKGDSVKSLQILLNGYGFSCGEVDASFGQKTDSAVKAFQKANGLTVDGIVGIATWTALLD